MRNRDLFLSDNLARWLSAYAKLIGVSPSQAISDIIIEKQIALLRGEQELSVVQEVLERITKSKSFLELSKQISARRMKLNIPEKR